MELNEITDPFITDAENRTVIRDKAKFYKMIEIILSVVLLLGVFGGIIYGIVCLVNDINKYGKYEFDKRHLIKCVVENSCTSCESSNFIKIVQECLVNLTIGS
jgi:hypothetical protein